MRFKSLDLHPTSYKSNGVGTISIPTADAARVEVFNSEMMTHRALLLHELVNAKTFPRKWPQWLETRVNLLLRKGLESNEIRNKILKEDHVYIKLKTVKEKLLKLKGQPAPRFDRGTPRLRGV